MYICVMFPYPSEWPTLSSFMMLLNQAKHKKLTKACKQDIISLLEIYMPNIKSKLTT